MKFCFSVFAQSLIHGAFHVSDCEARYMLWPFCLVFLCICHTRLEAPSSSFLVPNIMVKFQRASNTDEKTEPHKW